MSKLIKYLFVVFFITANTYSFAQSNLPKCEGEYNAITWTDCFGSRTTDGGNSYEGEYKNGKANGFGTFTFADGRKYVGSYDMGKRNGAGKEYGSDGKLLINGEWTNGTLTNTLPIQSNATTTVVDETKVTPKIETQVDTTVENKTPVTEEVVATETKSEVVNEVKEEVKKDKPESNTNNYELYFFIGMGALVALLFVLLGKLIYDKQAEVKPTSLKKQFNEIKTEFKNEKNVATAKLNESIKASTAKINQSNNAATVSVSKNQLSSTGAVVFSFFLLLMLGGLVFSFFTNSDLENKRPQKQNEFIAVLRDAQLVLKETKNEMQIFLAMEKRDKLVCEIMKDLSANNWTGKIKRLDSNTSSGYIKIEIGNDIEITTQDFQINSPFYVKLTSFNVGDKVKFSGTFERSSGSSLGRVITEVGDAMANGRAIEEPNLKKPCIKEISLTNFGGIAEPDFKFSLTELKKLD